MFCPTTLGKAIRMFAIAFLRDQVAVKTRPHNLETAARDCRLHLFEARYLACTQPDAKQGELKQFLRSIAAPSIRMTPTRITNYFSRMVQITDHGSKWWSRKAPVSHNVRPSEGWSKSHASALKFATSCKRRVSLSDHSMWIT